MGHVRTLSLEKYVLLPSSFVEHWSVGVCYEFINSISKKVFKGGPNTLELDSESQMAQEQST